MVHATRTILAILMSLTLLGCKEVVHSNLQELEANEIVAVLYARGISSSKQPLKDNLFSVSVPDAEFGAAIAILADAGLPRQAFNSISDVFPNDSVVGTPFEERARFAYALSQELSRTLAEVVGVHVARVHVVIPEQGRFEDEPPPSKAALAIYHKAEFDPFENLPQMKKLVAFSVPNLSYDDVSVSLFPASGITDVVIDQAVPTSVANAAGFATVLASASSGGDVASILIFAVLALAALTAVLRVVLMLRRLYNRYASHGI